MNFSDRYLRKRLRTWANRAPLPAEDVRWRLLEQAARPTPRTTQLLAWLNPGLALLFCPSESLVYAYQPLDWSHTLFCNDIVHSFRNGLSTSRLVI